METMRSMQEMQYFDHKHANVLSKINNLKIKDEKDN